MLIQEGATLANDVTTESEVDGKLLADGSAQDVRNTHSSPARPQVAIVAAGFLEAATIMLACGVPNRSRFRDGRP